MFFNRLKDVYETKYVNAAAWLIPRNVLTKVGGFDPLFFHYGEDDNYLNRVIYHGFKVGICPHSRIVHDCDNIGVRLHSVDEQERRRQLPLLVRFSDITKPDSLDIFIKYLRRKLFISILKNDFQKKQEIRRDLCFLKGKRTCIKKSRELNSKCGETWL